jgi:hypothetical protein
MRLVMKPFQLLALFLILGCARAPAHGNGAASQPTPQPPAATANAEQQAIMDRIERDVRLPDGADPLAAYIRYYAWQRQPDGGRKVVAVYTAFAAERPERPGRHWVAEGALPMVDDGGCGIVSLRYDVAAQRIEEIVCNAVG